MPTNETRREPGGASGAVETTNDSTLAAFVGALFEPDDILEVRTIWPDRGANKGARSRWVTAGSLPSDSDLVAAMSTANGNGWGVYVGANPRQNIGGKDAASVALARSVFADLDGIDVEAAQRMIRDAEIPPPTVLIDSGHGAHAYWRLDEPLTDLSDWTGRQRALIARLPTADTVIHDPPRVMRLPGFRNTKPPAAPCRIAEAHSSRVYSLVEFPPAATAIPTSPTVNGAHRKLSKCTRDFIVDGAAKGERNSRLFKAAADMNGAGFTRAEVEAKLMPVVVGPDFSEAEAGATIDSAWSKPRTPSVPAINGVEPRESQSAALVRIVKESAADLFHTPGGHDSEGYATVAVGDHVETWPIGSKAFRRWICSRFYTERHSAPSAQALQDAIGVLAGLAIYEGAERMIAVRLAEHDGAIWLDLADEEWRAVRIGPDGWRVVAGRDAPVRFVRKRGLYPLPVPVAGGTVDELRRLVNVPDDAAWRLIIAWIVAAFRPGRPFPILLVNGEAGSAKTTLCKMLRALIDPSKVPLRTPPQEERDLAIAASNSWVVAYDNLSGLRPELSDSLCRLATGGGFGKRENYSDEDECLFDYIRPALANGIDAIGTRGDLLDRAIILTLPAIPEENRRDESEVWREYERVRPRVLGALLAAVSAALARVESVRPDRLPRMADFARWAIAAESTLGWPIGSFLSAYSGNRSEAHEAALGACPIVAPLMALIDDRAGWSGSASDLLHKLSESAGLHRDARPPVDWPKRPNSLTAMLRRLAPDLRAVGIEVDLSQRTSDRRRARVVVLTRTDGGNIVRIVHTPRNPHPDVASGASCGRSADDPRPDDRPASSSAIPAGAVLDAPPDDADDADDPAAKCSIAPCETGDGDWGSL